ncbi:MAG: hypothetical protein KGI27_12975 [Thaumarchaeota archaeon]|nr:hypothetical protein [Nitrososphaerota archaeon]
MDEYGLKNSIRLVIGGYLFDGGEVEDIPSILKDMATDYNLAIESEQEE